MSEKIGVIGGGQMGSQIASLAAMAGYETHVYDENTENLTSKLKFVEEHKHLYHYVSEIKGKLIKNTSTQNIIKAMMPGGSVIGCPKINTLNLLNQQEKDNRNIFTGSFGFIDSNLDMRFNIIIRSILNYKNKSEISVASGVVTDSTPKREFNENYIKAKSLLNLF